ncbi:hypothetical protein AB0F07_03850 [Streptomyces fructofermentans]|uniref:hypothetical protein n=1 Tax=Streptomyces fructofermentans TaxID=152141 RepID=UPI0033ED9341
MAEYEGIDALLAALTDEPLPEGAGDDAEFAAEHRAAVADVALLREQLKLMGDTLAAESEHAERTERTERPERTERTEHAERTERTEHAERTERSADPGQVDPGRADSGDAGRSAQVDATHTDAIHVEPAHTDAADTAPERTGRPVLNGRVRHTAPVGRGSAAHDGAGEQRDTRAPVNGAGVAHRDTSGSPDGPEIPGGPDGEVGRGDPDGPSGRGTALRKAGTSGTATAPRRAGPPGRTGPAGRHRVRRYAAVAVGALAVATATTVLGGLVWLGQNGAGDADVSKAESSQADSKAGGSLDGGRAEYSPERHIACSKVLVEGTVRSITPTADDTVSVVLKVKHYYRPERSVADHPTIAVTLADSAREDLKVGMYTLVRVPVNPQERQDWETGWGVGDARKDILRALPGARGVPCPDGTEGGTEGGP